MDDTTLLIRLTRGDQVAAGELWQRYGGPVRAYAAAILRSHADGDDVAQDVFVSLLRLTPARAAEVRVVRVYLIASARMACIGVRRARVRRARREARWATAGWAGTAGGRDGPLELAVAELPLRQREAVVLRSVVGLTVDEAAVATGLPRTTVASRHAAGLDSLRRRLGVVDAAQSETANGPLAGRAIP